MKPSDKQIDFAQAIAEELGIDPPFGGDAEAYSEFIRDNVDEFYRERNRTRYACNDVFQLNHAYTLKEYEYDEINMNPMKRG